MARRTLEPLLQALSREHLLDSTARSAWRLPAWPARPSDQGLGRYRGRSEQPGGRWPDLTGRLHRAVIEPLWDEFDALLLAQTEALTIEDLLKRAAKAGLRKPISEPLNFVI